MLDSKEVSCAKQDWKGSKSHFLLFEAEVVDISQGPTATEKNIHRGVIRGNYSSCISYISLTCQSSNVPQLSPNYGNLVMDDSGVMLLIRLSLVPSVIKHSNAVGSHGPLKEPNPWQVPDSPFAAAVVSWKKEEKSFGGDPMSKLPDNSQWPQSQGNTGFLAA